MIWLIKHTHTTAFDSTTHTHTHTHTRVILLHLINRFDFSLGKISAAYQPENFFGVNRATLGPQDIGEDPNKPAKLGMYLKITPRTAPAPTPKF